MSIAISLISVAIAVLSFAFAIFSWRHANRPLVTARIIAFSGGNNAITLNILIENTGNRPAKDIQLIAERSDVLAALKDSDQIPIDAERCFFSNVSIPILIHGKSTSNAFGHLGNPEGSWKPGAVIHIKVVYRDLGLRRYSSRLRLLLSDDTSFAQTTWGNGTGHGG